MYSSSISLTLSFDEVVKISCVSKINGKEAMHRPDILKEKEKKM
jgi:hypothetical protein